MLRLVVDDVGEVLEVWRFAEKDSRVLTRASEGSGKEMGVSIG